MRDHQRRASGHHIAERALHLSLILGVEWFRPLVGYGNALWRGVGLGVVPLAAGLFLPFWTSFLFAAVECLLVTGSFLLARQPQSLNDSVTILANVFAIAITFAVIGAAYAASTAKAVMQADRTAEIEQAHADLAAAYTKLEALATTDPITGALNHRAFSEHLIRAVTTARSDHTPLGVIFADVDHFKQVNDTWGHQIGDAVLAHLASLLREIVEDSGLLARYGGEEFVMLLPKQHDDQIISIAEQARVLVAATPLALPGGNQISITASFGVAAYPIDGATAELLLKAADFAMYQAKKTGRNRVCSAVDLRMEEDAA